MSLASVRPFFRSRLNGLGFIEHFDAFDDQNVQQSGLDGKYQLDSGPVSASITGNQTFQFDFDVTVKIFLSGGQDNLSLVDRAFEVADDVVSDILQSDVRLGSDVKNVLPASITVAPLSTSDDNDLILSLVFTGIVICNY